MSFKNAIKISGLVTFIVSLIVYYFSVEPTGSLWDCGEFVLGAYKLQVVHPPGAPLFILIGRLFTWVATIFSDDPSAIAFAVNMMSAISTALAAALVAMMTVHFGKILLVGREGAPSSDANIALTLGGIAGGLSAAFATSVWFSAVEGEVYAMSTFFTALTYYAAVKWYSLPDEKDHDRWLVFCIFSAGLSIGVHLLSLLTFPAIAVLYYFKKYHGRTTLLGAVASMAIGAAVIGIIQKFIIVGIPSLWYYFELFMVNSLGMGQHSGLIPTILIVAGLAYALLRWSHKKGYYLLQLATVSLILVSVAFSTIGTVVIRANADTPVNMNVPSDAMRLLPYLNREQYGERPLLRGPKYNATPDRVDKADRYGYVDGKYIPVDEKFSYQYKNSDKIIFPRIGHTDGSKPAMHNKWRDALYGNHNGAPSFAYNIRFLTTYQLGWMYWRYFMWNFVGRQNGEQGYYPWDVRNGHWQSGIGFVDEAKLYNMEKLPDTMANDPAKNTYYFLPLIFGLIGLIYHASKDKKSFLSLLTLFIVTGIGIIIYSNQPPNEPRERDYVLVGSFLAFSVWIGLAVVSIYTMLREKVIKSGLPSAAIAGALVLTAPIIMGFQNFDDHSRSDHTAARDYASNFLNSVDENAIIFTYGDNDTYPLWYAQEVEGIRTDVRVVNLSLIAVDWYINKLRNKVNDSDPIKLTLTEENYRGKNLNQVFFFNPRDREDKEMKNFMPLVNGLKFIASPKSQVQGQSYIDSKYFFVPVNQQKILGSKVFEGLDTTNMSNILPIVFSPSKNYITKDDLAILDIIASNFYDRPIYFATTCINEKLMGLNDFMQLEGLALRLVPTRNKSDRSFGIQGSGKVATEKAYNHIMNDWKWGNFDNVDTYVDGNYMAAVYSMRMTMYRLSMDLLNKGQTKKSADIAKKFFEAFPHMNFAYDTSVLPFIRVLVETGEFDEAKKHLRILADESVQYMEFFKSLDSKDLNSFEDNMRYRAGGLREVEAMSKMVEDPSFAKEINDKIGEFVGNLNTNPLN